MMYADKMVFLKFQSASDLQSFGYFRKLYIEMVVYSYREKKTTSKIMVSRNGGNFKRTEDVGFYNCEQIEEVNSYCYLGLLLNFNGKFHVTQKQLSLYSPSLRSSEYIIISA